ncbi:p21-activated protein kinase-interacting protein 1-like protein [Thelohanellus kitauei]|uniref:p21-activated protein kinase-interacting protein 1-like protein n=1 Tax=Thelohanellus kitauei TaxID=669202 RepID=A0A0C2JUU4_THEKT|nr:p21-activated protein kinase-interacting protein 1-like protein [Thelohanellus kitauei]
MACFGVGTDSGFIHSFQTSSVYCETTNNQYFEITSFVFNPYHTGTIKCLAVCRRYIASSCSDGVIEIYDNVLKRDIGCVSLIGRPNELNFYRSQLLVATCADGYIRVWSTSCWFLVYEIKAHIPGHSSITFLKNSYCFQTVGADKYIKVWHLKRRRFKAKAKLESKPFKICSSNDTDRYAIIFEDYFRVYNYSIYSTKTIEQTEVLAVCFLGEYIVYGGEFNHISIYSIDKNRHIVQWDTQYTKTIDLKVLRIPSFGPVILATHFEGEVVVYDARNICENENSPIFCRLPLHSRPTCFAVENN